MAGSRYSSTELNKYVTYCEIHDRWISWRKRKGICQFRVIAKKGAPPTWSFCEHFCECWGHLDNQPEVLCNCLGIEKACKEVR